MSGLYLSLATRPSEGDEALVYDEALGWQRARYDGEHWLCESVTGYHSLRFVRSAFALPAMILTRRERVDAAIKRGNVAELLGIVEFGPCACSGSRDNEPLCSCRMSAKQVRDAVSYAMLRRGKLVRLKVPDRAETGSIPEQSR